MLSVEPQLPDWIHRYVTLVTEHNTEPGPDSIPVEEDVPLWCPRIFEAYAVGFHPFGINGYTDEVSGEFISTAISWASMFAEEGYELEPGTALNTYKELCRKEHINSANGILFPAEGYWEWDALQHVLDKLLQLYGDIEVNSYYALLKTKQWDESKLYSSKLSKIALLRNDKDLRGTPTAIFPDNKEWCIITEYDTIFTNIGGTKEFIESITLNNPFEIYQVHV